MALGCREPLRHRPEKMHKRLPRRTQRQKKTPDRVKCENNRATGETGGTWQHRRSDRRHLALSLARPATGLSLARQPTGHLSLARPATGLPRPARPHRCVVAVSAPLITLHASVNYFACMFRFLRCCPCWMREFLGT